MNNKATRFNRSMGIGMLALGIVLLLIVFGMLYLSFQMQSDRDSSSAQGDSILLIDHTDRTAAPVVAAPADSLL